MNASLLRLSTAPWWRRLPVPLVATLLQGLLTALTFSRLLRYPGLYSLAPYYDGIKSDFSLASLLRQPLSQGAIVHGHNYPFGEYYYYLDITPLVAGPLHVLVRAVPALQPYGLHLYRLIIIGLALPLSTWLAARLLRRFGLPALLRVVLAVALPWLAPQTWRLLVGHLSLALTPTILATLWCLQELHLGSPEQGPQRRWRWLLALVLGAAPWLHFYYLLMLPALAGAYILVVAWERHAAGVSWAAIRAWLVPILGAIGGVLVLTPLVLWLVDPLTGIRPKSAGYGWLEWKMQFGGWFRGYDYNKIRFIFEPGQNYPYEPMQYLGGFALFGLLLAGGAWLLVRRSRPAPPAEEVPAPALPWPPLAADPAGRFVRAALVAAVPLAIMALGETYELDGGAYVLHNYFNPLFWLRKLVPQLAQFRALARFAWPFWWGLNLLVAWGLAAIWRQPARGWRWLTLVPLVVLGLDLKDAVRYYRHHFAEARDPLADPAAGANLPTLLGGTQPQQYQALLPLPFYHVGADGEYEYTIDPDEGICTRSYQLGMLTGLPLLAHKATRTPPAQAKALWSLFDPAAPPDSALLRRLRADPRPILVYLDSSYYDGSNTFYHQTQGQRPTQLAWIEQGDDFIRQHGLRRLGKVGKESCYVWEPRRQ